MNVNKAMLVGRITKDPELKSLPSGVQVCSFAIATNEFYKDKSGQKQEKTEFHNIVVFGNAAENVARYMSKGNEIYIEGKIQTRSWDAQDGSKRYRTEIVAQSVQFGAKAMNSGKSGTSTQEVPKSPADEQYDSMGGSQESEEDINVEDIPF